MTCVVGVKGKNGVLLAGDSQGSTTYSNRKFLDAKADNISEIVAYAYCGSARLGNLLTYHVPQMMEDPPLGWDEHRWVVREFIPLIRWIAADHGLLEIHHNAETLGDAAFLLAVRDRLFTVDCDLQVSEGVLPFEALGSGDDVAIGALHGQTGDVRDPIDDDQLEYLATIAVEVASELTNFVGGDIRFARTTKYTEDEKAIAKAVLGAK